LNIVLNVFWIKSLGINGAALATLVSYLAMPLGLFIFFYFRRRFLEKDNALV
jgi:Na+-driven multidrug efflux pump